MKKLSVIGLDTNKELLMSKLMDLGSVQITEKKIDDDRVLAVLSDDDQEKITSLDNQISDVALALETLEKYGNKKQPLFFTRRDMTHQQFEKELKSRQTIMGDVRGILKLRQDMHKLQEAKNKGEGKISALRPWTVYDLPLNMTSTAYTEIDLGIVPATVDVEKLKGRLEEQTPAVALKEINRDKDFIYLVVVAMKEDVDAVMTTLKQSGYSQTSLKGFDGTVSDNETMIKKEIAEKQRLIKQTEAMIAGRYGEKDAIECLYDQLVIERDKEQAKALLLKTKRTFSFDGWVPEKYSSKVEKVLKQMDCYYKWEEPSEDDEVPVLIENNRVVQPFESVMEMYSLPAYRAIDPTRFFAFFYAMFFGIMLSDAGYGVVITLITFILLRMYKVEGMTYKMIKMFFYCGLSTIFWGSLFGGWFGDFVQVVGRQFLNMPDLKIKPIWYDPITDPTKLLLFSLAIGVIHMFLGMGLKAYMLIRDGKPWDALCDVGFWYTLLIGGGLWLGGSPLGETAVIIGKWMAIASAVLILATGGRKNKGLGKAVGGFGSLYNVTGYVSDILSYARLLALGLATGVIAQVVNTIGSLFGSGVVGAILFALIFVVGHTFNLGINALGAFVHTSRLQYIEFFGKFYEDGGEEFKPFAKHTKYVKLNDETMEVGK